MQQMSEVGDFKRQGTVAQNASGEDVLMPDVEAMKEAKELRALAPDSNLVQLVVGTLQLGIDFFKVAMSSLLSIFTPQACPLLDPPSTPPICYAVATGPVTATNDQWADFNVTTHDCDINENFTNLTDFNKFVLGWNFITLGVMIGHYVLTWRRERFIINKLEISNTDSRIHLKDIIRNYPHIEERLSWYNKHVFALSVFGMVCQFVNVVTSAVLVFRDYYAGFRAVTSFITSVLITATVMQRAAENTWIGLKHKLAYSCVAFEPVSYNTIDPSFRNNGQQ
jgi:hypothetical protein